MKNAISVIAIIASFVFGWIANSWRHDSIRLAERQAAEKVVKLALERENLAAVAVEKRLQELKANERIIEHKTREIIERPVYRVECIDADGLRIISDYARGNATQSTREMPDHAASAHQ